MHPDDPVHHLLTTGTVEIEGRMPWSSNGTYLVTVRGTDHWTRAIYKPRGGERPLWDFPNGLDRREVAAYELSHALGWDLVPTTTLREGPLGPGSVQLFVDADFEQHYFSMYEAGRHLDRWRAMCLFDLVANNTDRKSGHCLVSVGGRAFGIDHGLCFHEDFKLRTVIWEFGGEPVPEPLRDDLRRFEQCGLPEALCQLLTPSERDALCERVAQVVAMDRYPIDGSGRRYPWPLV